MDNIQDRFVAKLIELATNNPKKQAVCSYTETDDDSPIRDATKPGCIVGHAVYELGLMSLEELRDFDVCPDQMFQDNGSINPNPGNWSFRTLNAYFELTRGFPLVSETDVELRIINVQREQDNGRRWGYAIEPLRKVS